MIAKKQSTGESEEMQGRRIKVGKLQRIGEAFKDLTPGEKKLVKGGLVVISIIGVLIAPSVRRQ